MEGFYFMLWIHATFGGFAACYNFDTPEGEANQVCGRTLTECEETLLREKEMDSRLGISREYTECYHVDVPYDSMALNLAPCSVAETNSNPEMCQRAHWRD